MGYKQKSGILQRAGYDKDATSPFPQKTDSTSGDKLPSYNVTTYNASASASGGGSSSSSNSSNSNSSNSNSLTSSKTNFSSDPVEKAKQQQWIKNNPKKYKQMLAEKKNATQQPAANAANNATANNASSNSGQSFYENTDTETITLGDQTLNQIKKGNSTLSQNRQEKQKAIRENARNQAVIDSGKVANERLNKLPVSAQLDPKQLELAQRSGNAAARRALFKDKVYSAKEAKEMVPYGKHYFGEE
jgi:hypothetical protein